MELTNKLKKETASLGERKWRKRLGLFKAEGTKCVVDTLDHFPMKAIFATQEWTELHRDEIADLQHQICVCKKADIIQMSSLSTPAEVIAVYEMPAETAYTDIDSESLVIALDGIQDPGNLGTIVRTADWFGIRRIICSNDTADVFNPKSVQATMGAIARVRTTYCDLPETLARLSAQMPVYGTFLEGNPIYKAQLSANGIIVMGNEGNGIRPQVKQHIGRKLLIPSAPDGSTGSESLNVATATAIVISEFTRRL